MVEGLVEAPTRPPAELAARAADVGDDHGRGMVTLAATAEANAVAATEPFGGARHQLTERHGLAGGDVDRAADVAVEQVDQAAGGVADEEVVATQAVEGAFGGAAAQQAEDRRGEQTVLVLAGTVEEEEARPGTAEAVPGP